MPLPPQTIKGYNTYEVLSAMQKDIRRGNESAALYWAIELTDSGFFAMAVNRLRVTAFEDIGIADKETVLFVVVCLDQAMTWKKANNDAWYLALADAVLALCRAKKSRISDSFQAAVMSARQKENLPMPDYALDKHTARGRRLGRGLDHFIQEGAQLSNEDAATPDPYLDEAVRFWKAEDEAKQRSAQEKANPQGTLI